jgi:hypothetical protein
MYRYPESRRLGHNAATSAGVSFVAVKATDEEERGAGRLFQQEGLAVCREIRLVRPE